MKRKFSIVYVVSTYRDNSASTILYVYESFKDAYDFCLNLAQESVESYNSGGDGRCAWYKHNQWFEDHTWKVYYSTFSNNVAEPIKTIKLEERYLRHSLKEES